MYNYKQKIRLKNLAGRTPLHALAFHLADVEEIYWDYLLDEEQKVIGLFWSPHGCIDLIKANSEVLIFNCTYKTNRYNISLFDIVGVNCLQQIFYGGFCFLAREEEADYK